MFCDHREPDADGRAGWHIYDLTGSAWDLGLVGLYQFTPSLLLTLWSGHVAGRAQRDRIIAVCMVAQALIDAASQGALTGAPWVTRELLLLVSVAASNPRRTGTI